MEKAKLFRSPLQEREAKLVAGVSRKDVGMQSKLYDYCKRYFWTNYRGLFFINENDAVEIFQNSFITLWENIERGKIMACDGIVVGKTASRSTAAFSPILWALPRTNIRNGPGAARRSTILRRSSR